MQPKAQLMWASQTFSLYLRAVAKSRQSHQKCSVYSCSYHMVTWTFLSELSDSFSHVGSATVTQVDCAPINKLCTHIHTQSSEETHRCTLPFIERATKSCRCTPLHTARQRPDCQSSHKCFSCISESCRNSCQQLRCLINPPRDHPVLQGVRVLCMAPLEVQRNSLCFH